MSLCELSAGLILVVGPDAASKQAGFLSPSSASTIKPHQAHLVCLILHRNVYSSARDEVLLVCLQVGESINDLTSAEQEARKGHSGIWMYGDPGSESDEEHAPQPSAWGRR